MKNLISSVEFGKLLSDKSDKDYRRLRDGYDNFIRKDLGVGQFVPADQNGNVLEEPQMLCRQITFDEWEDYFDLVEVEDYRKAKSKVLFEGFKYIGEKHVGCGHTIIGLGFKNGYYKKIEDLANLIDEEIKLTPNALKEIGL